MLFFFSLHIDRVLLFLCFAHLYHNHGRMMLKNFIAGFSLGSLARSLTLHSFRRLSKHIVQKYFICFAISRVDSKQGNPSKLRIWLLFPATAINIREKAQDTKYQYWTMWNLLACFYRFHNTLKQQTKQSMKIITEQLRHEKSKEKKTFLSRFENKVLCAIIKSLFILFFVWMYTNSSNIAGGWAKTIMRKSGYRRISVLTISHRLIAHMLFSIRFFGGICSLWNGNYDLSCVM